MMTIEQEPSSDDDASQKASAPADATGQPWWANHPAIIAAREGVEKWIGSAERESTPPDNSDAIHDEAMNGSCGRELRGAREDLDRARVRYANAVRAARAVGFSWAEIGRLLGVPRQSVHRRFRDDVDYG
jgi:DNA-directed RNA polymerase specialized sigma24 family protein